MSDQRDESKDVKPKRGKVLLRHISPRRREYDALGRYVGPGEIIEVDGDQAQVLLAETRSQNVCCGGEVRVRKMFEQA